MKYFLFIGLFFISFLQSLTGQDITPDFRWGNGTYFNLDIGEKTSFRNLEIELLQLKNHFNQIKIGKDTVWLKVSRRTLPVVTNGIRVFVADNKNVKALTACKEVHGVLNKDALICLSDFREPLLDLKQFAFPVSFNDGFRWSTEEASYQFSYPGKPERREALNLCSYGGIDFDLHDARGKEKHWLVAIENSKVVWIEEDELDTTGKAVSVLFESESNPEIFYLYEHLYKENVLVKKGQSLMQGEPLGTIWGDGSWGHLHFSVLKSDSVPPFSNRYQNLVNGFPQVYELYFKQTAGYSRTFSKGRIYFGRRQSINGNQKNVMAYESYSGKGWNLGRWNAADKVEWVWKEDDGNARLKKVLFEGSRAACKNPHDFFDFEINVRNGTYRIRAKVGDLALPSWQKMMFEGIEAGEFLLDAGEFEWTTERIVKVDDGKLTVRIFIDAKNQKISGLSQVVFQRAF